MRVVGGWVGEMCGAHGQAGGSVEAAARAGGEWGWGRKARLPMAAGRVGAVGAARVEARGGAYHFVRAHGA